MMPVEINDYRVIQKLGYGKSGKVYLVQAPNQQQYALKLIQVSPQTKEFAKKEAELYVTLNHPNILKAREYFFYNKEKYLVIILEYCPDGSLASFVGKTSTDSSRKLLKGLAEGLHYLHGKNIAHKEVRPENILMLKDQVKITVLDLSKLFQTSGKTICHSLHYLAPEVLQQDKYDEKADIWSFGIMTLELLLGKRIKDLVKTSVPSLKADFPTTDLLNEIKDTEMRGFVKRLLRKSPEDRLDSYEILDFLSGKKLIAEDTEKKPEEMAPLKQLFAKKIVKNAREKPQYRFSDQHRKQFWHN